MYGENFGGTGSMDPLGHDVKSLIEEMAKPGWSGLDMLEAMIENRNGQKPEFSSDDRLNELYWTCFNSSAGQAVLKDLIENVVLVPSGGRPPNWNAEQVAMASVEDNAKKALVWHILYRMRNALIRLNKTTGGNTDEQTS